MHKVFEHIINLYLTFDIRSERVEETLTTSTPSKTHKASERALWTGGLPVPLYPLDGETVFCKDTRTAIDLFCAARDVTGVDLRSDGSKTLRLVENMERNEKTYEISQAIPGMPIVISSTMFALHDKELYGYGIRIFIQRKYSYASGGKKSG
ncbi:MAG: hypothetical protein HGA67_00720 [Candidatus Yonathbacteria bacterium]|nr:hypothetical protein [Candidatus Yonathbacteria bacterium]